MGDSQLDFKGYHCLVTGGTKGIGKAVVEEFGRLGAKVFTCARNADLLQAQLAEWKAKGWDVEGCSADVSSEEECKKLVDQVKTTFGEKLHILVNNAGTNIRTSALDYTLKDINTLLDLNLTSGLLLSKLCHPLLKSAGGSSIVFMSSVAGGNKVMNSGAVYAVSKAGLDQLTRVLACEWAIDKIRVNAVAPWYINTPLAQQVLSDPDFKERVVRETPMQRVGEPEEVSGVVAFFCSKSASFITGQVLKVDGGYSVQGFGYQ